MKNTYTHLLVVIFAFLLTATSFAQETVNSKYIDRKGRTIKYNIIKTNLLGWPLGVFNLAYERKLNKKFSALIEIDIFAKPIISKFNRNSGYWTTSPSGFAISPELRWYLGRNGSPRGYYLGIYLPIINYNSSVYSYAKESQTVFFANDGSSQVLNIESSGRINPSFTFRGIGLSGGPQFIIGNRISLEFYLNVALGVYSLSDRQIVETGKTSTIIPGSPIASGSYTAAELLSKGVAVSPSEEYSYAIQGQNTGNVLEVTYTKENSLKEIKEYDSGLIVVPRFGFSVGYAFGK